MAMKRGDRFFTIFLVSCMNDLPITKIEVTIQHKSSIKQKLQSQ